MFELVEGTLNQVPPLLVGVEPPVALTRDPSVGFGWYDGNGSLPVDEAQDSVAVIFL